MPKILTSQVFSGVGIKSLGQGLSIINANTGLTTFSVNSQTNVVNVPGILTVSDIQTNSFISGNCQIVTPGVLLSLCENDASDVSQFEIRQFGTGDSSLRIMHDLKSAAYSIGIDGSEQGNTFKISSTSILGSSVFTYDNIFFNIKIGKDAGLNFVNYVGNIGNTFIGTEAGRDFTNGGSNVAIGVGAFRQSNGVSLTVALGTQAGDNIVSGDGNIAIGSNSLVGQGAGLTGEYNIAMGYQSGAQLNTGDNNIFIGKSSGEGVVTGVNNISIGENSLRSATFSSNGIIGIGTGAASGTTTGSDIIAIGNNTLLNGPVGDDTIAIGSSAGLSATGATSLFIGSGSGAATTGINNAYVGHAIAAAATTSANNAVFGNLSASLLSTGNQNTLVGSQTSRLLTSGNNNTVIGYTSGANITTGDSNIIIGSASGSAVIASDNNIAIGSAGSNSGDTITIGSTHTTCRIAGIRGVTTDVADAIPVLIDSTGQLGTVSSSKRYKNSISSLENTECLLELNPVKFKYNNRGDKYHYGLIAEQVDGHLPELVIRDAGGNPDTVSYNQLHAYYISLLKKHEQRIRDLEKSMI